MTSSSFSPLLRPFLFSALAAVATLTVVGCSGKVEPSPESKESSVNGTNGTGNGGTSGGTSSSGSTTNPVGSGNSNACAGKACGVDCSPEGSDEPFNCNSAGQCVVNEGKGFGCTPPAPECAGKACGVDCTPAGSDEPFNCNSSGQCVATGTPLNCKVCPEFLADCIQGEAPADTDGDGCVDACRPVK